MNGSNLMSEHQQSGLVVNWPLSVQALITSNDFDDDIEQRMNSILSRKNLPPP
jgi:hypothetical protein